MSKWTDLFRARGGANCEANVPIIEEIEEQDELQFEEAHPGRKDFLPTVG